MRSIQGTARGITWYQVTKISEQYSAVITLTTISYDLQSAPSQFTGALKARAVNYPLIYLHHSLFHGRFFSFYLFPIFTVLEVNIFCRVYIFFKKLSKNCF